MSDIWNGWAWGTGYPMPIQFGWEQTNNTIIMPDSFTFTLNGKLVTSLKSHIASIPGEWSGFTWIDRSLIKEPIPPSPFGWPTGY